MSTRNIYNKEKPFVIYKVTNLINNKIYIGQHQKMDPYYLGSGKLIKQAVKKYGKESFSFNILFEYDNFDDMNKKEEQLVDEKFIKLNTNYNIVQGGSSNGLVTSVTIKNSDGSFERISKNDDKWINKKVVGCAKNTVVCFDPRKNEYVRVNQKNIDDELIIGSSTGMKCIKDSAGNNKSVKINDDKYKNSPGVRKGLLTVKSIDGEYYGSILITDERLYKSLIPIQTFKIFITPLEKLYNVKQNNIMKIGSQVLRKLCDKDIIISELMYKRNKWLNENYEVNVIGKTSTELGFTTIKL